MQIKTTNYTTRDRYGRSLDNVTEFSIVLDKSLSEEELQEILKQNGINLYGFVSFTKKLLTYFDIETMTKRVKYMHIAQEAMSVN